MFTTLCFAFALVLQVTGNFALVLQVTGAVPQGRVVEGVEVEPHSFPWQLSLKYNNYHTCGAVVYDSYYALTAAHCVDGRSAAYFTVTCGAHNIHAVESSQQTVAIANYTVHPDYDPRGNGFPNDIAVLRLSEPLLINDQCQAARLDTGDIVFNNIPAVITGWGRLEGGGALPSKLKRGEVEALSYAKCRQYYSGVNEVHHLCVKDLGDQVFGGCNGDSGGPAHIGDTVVGLASFVFGSCLTSYPTVYARVSSYIFWIQQTAPCLW